jgi:isocitrate/isopropylmalate dehydrogenase
LRNNNASKAIFEATEGVINEDKYVTYYLGGKGTLYHMADQISARAASDIRR